MFKLTNRELLFHLCDVLYLLLKFISPPGRYVLRKMVFEICFQIPSGIEQKEMRGISVGYLIFLEEDKKSFINISFCIYRQTNNRGPNGLTW